MVARKEFLKRSATVVFGSLMANKFYNSFFNSSGLIDRVGLQLFSIPKILVQDFKGTMKMLAQIGFKELELFGPYPFSAETAKERWKPIGESLGIEKTGYFGLDIKDFKKILEDNGLSTPAMHIDIETLKTRLSETAEAANLLGQRYVIIPSAPTRSTLDEYKKDADEFNEIGAKADKLGLRFGYHNHGNGLKAIDGQVPFELIMERTDPKLVDFEMDIYWTTAGGIDPSAYLDKYPGRFRLMHVKDMVKDVRFSGDGGNPQQWIELFPFMTDAGSGVLDLKKILTHAKTSGVQHFFVERDLAPNPDEALKKAYQYLTTL